MEINKYVTTNVVYLMKPWKNVLKTTSPSHRCFAVNSLARIERPSSTEAQVWFSPSVEQQRELAKKFGDKKDVAGLGGQFVVQYDVERDPQAGEVLVSSIRKWKCTSSVSTIITGLTAYSTRYPIYTTEQSPSEANTCSPCQEIPSINIFE
jgi:hypothetical protein